MENYWYCILEKKQCNRLEAIACAVETYLSNVCVACVLFLCALWPLSYTTKLFNTVKKGQQYVTSFKLFKNSHADLD